MDILSTEIDVPMDFIDKQKEFAKYGIEYENSGNFFEPMLTFSKDLLVYPGLWFLSKDCARFPKLREAMTDIDRYIMELNSDKIFVKFKTYTKYRKANKYISYL